jgi:hypothetical protein
MIGHADILSRQDDVAGAVWPGDLVAMFAVWALAPDRVPRRGVARGVEVTTISGRPESVRLP